MRVLIACEDSGTVRDAFRKLGHEAWSCDFLPNTGGHHFQMDIRDVLKEYYLKWDMMIAFPDCTHLCVSGARYFKDKIPQQNEALYFIRFLMNIRRIPKIAIENPVGVISTRIRKPDQIIQPWQFGEDASKKTCLWLKGLPKLIPTNIIKKERYGNQTPSGQNKLGPSKDRARLRAKTYQGIADAMAEQWGGLVVTN
ncbi:MAG: DNA cytosine methyltransferase [Thaumarchaeota archaeon]|nr:DNA cytosine methyltransferase [Nitrososphaerota archaeon]